MNGRTGASSASTNLGGSSLPNTATIVVPGQQGTSHAVHITEAEPSAFAQYHVWIQSNPGSATSFPTSGANPFLLEPPKLNLFAPTMPSTFSQLAYPQRPGQAFWLPPPPNDIAVLADPLQSPEAKRDAAMRLALDVYLSVMSEGALGVIMSRTAAAASRLALQAEARSVGRGLGAQVVNEAVGLDIQSAAQAERLRLSLAADEILNSPRAGSGLKADPVHRAASFVSREQLEAGKLFNIRGGDGVQRQLLQTTGEMNGRVGIFEFIVDPSRGVTHQRFIPGGWITGAPNQRVP